MGGFGRIEAAAAMREIIKEAAAQVVDANRPAENYGRVISVNASGLTATVWFPGDEAPITVNMFPNSIPGQWHERFGLGSGAGVTSTPYVGYGSQVAVRDFNGKKYITQVLSGGVLSAEAKSLGQSVVTQEATEIAADQAGNPVQIVGDPHETFINCHIQNFTLPDGGAIQFGPFTALNSELPDIGWMEVTVVELAGSAKTFKFPCNPLRDFDHTGGTSSLDSWYRILPEQQINDNAGQVIDFDFEIAIKRTPYGDIDQFFQNAELWMRVIKRGSAWTGLNCKVTIRATNIQRGRALSGRELFMQESLISPPEAKGFVGFHNSQMIFRDFGDYGVLDNFGRTIASGGWGTSDSGPVYLVRNGSAANFGVDGQAAFISNTASGVVGLITLQQSNIMNTDIYFDVWVPVMPTGAEIQTGVVSRWVDNNNFYWFKVVFQTSGQITLSLTKTVAGVSTVLGTDLNPAGVTFTAGERIRARARITLVGAGPTSALFIKAWKPATQREPDWLKVETDSSLGANAGNFAGFFSMPGGANSNTKPFKTYFDNIRASLYAKGQDNSGAQWHSGPWRSGLLRLAQSLQRTWICTGQITWDGSRIFWTDRIYFGGVGQHRNGLAAGSTMMQCPPSGFTVPVVPNGGTVSVTSAGIPLNPGQALYVAIPPGQTWENLYEYLFIVDNVSALNYDLPEWAILIAMRSDTTTSGSELRLGNGERLDRWRTPSFKENWSNYGASHEVAGYRMEAANVVRLRGLVKNTSTTALGVIYQLPLGYRPRADHVFSVHSSSAGAVATSRVDVNLNGEVNVISHGTGGGTSYLSLAGITFEASIF